MVGCQKKNQSKSSSSINNELKSKNSNVSKLTIAEKEATKNRKTFTKELKGLTRIQRNYSAIYLKETPKILSESSKNSDLTVRALITKTTPDNYENEAHTIYTLFIKDVYKGDKSFIGKSIDLIMMGGKIKNSELYEYSQQKESIPKDKKLTPKQLNEYTVVQADGHDPAAPGDEVVATLTGKYNNRKQQMLYRVISSNWVFYKQDGSKQFLTHYSKVKGTGGGHEGSDGIDPRMGDEQNDNGSSTKESEQVQKAQNDVNTMVKTGKIPND